MTAPILLPDVRKRSEATSRPQNLPQKTPEPQNKCGPGRSRTSNHWTCSHPGAHPGCKDNATSNGLLVLWQKRYLPTKSTSPHNTPAHWRKKKGLGTSGFCPTWVQKNLLEQSSTQQLQETELHLLLLCWLTPLQTNKWLHACLHNAKAAKPMGCLPD